MCRSEKKDILLICKSETGIAHKRIKTAIHGTVWEEITGSSKPGRTPVHNIFRDMSGLTGYAKQCNGSTSKYSIFSSH